MATKTKRIGFASDMTAARAAKRRGLFGLSGSGRACCPVELPHERGWGFWTDHDHYHCNR